MNKKSGFSTVAAIIILIVVALLGFATYKIITAKKVDTAYTVFEGNTSNGYIADHVKGGNADEAVAIIFEYADYQCPGCATINPKINTALEALGGKVVVVYRSFLLSYHQNGTAAASAAEAAGLQGYWKEYANKLFEMQDEWEYSEPSDRTEYFNKYFLEVSDNKGDLEKFNKDISSQAVSDKISADIKLANHVGIDSTPALFIDGQNIQWTKAGSININGRTVSWDNSVSTTDDLIKLFEDIVSAKTAE